MSKSTRELADDFVRAAAFLKRELEGRNNTLEYLRSDPENRTILVFDTDVIITTCAPWITGPAGEDDNNGYGVIFSDPDASSPNEARQKQLDRKAESTASILANHAIRMSRQGIVIPLFQLPSHAAETNIVYRAVRRQVEGLGKIGRREVQLRQQFEVSRAVALVRHRLSTGADIDDVRGLIENIVSWLVYDGPPSSKRARSLREWDSYYNLEAEFGGLFCVNEIGAFMPEAPELVKACAVTLRNERSPAEDRLFSDLTDHWKRKFEQRGRRNIEVDAEAFAHLLLINQRLSKTKWRCVFVTGDRTLARAAYTGIPAELLPEQQRSIGDEFSLKYVRHLWANTADALIEPDRQQNFADLFNGLLANWSENLRFSTTMLEEIADGRSHKPGRYVLPDGLARVLNEWESLTSKSIARHTFEESRKYEPLQRLILNAVTRLNLTGGWSELQGLLREEVDRARDRTVLSMSDLGVDVIIRAERLGKRNPPELIFDSLGHANAMLQRLSLAVGYSSTADFEADFNKIAIDCHNPTVDGDDRQLSYLKFVVLGATFASADRWLIALNHARRAIAIARRARTRRSPIPTRSTPALSTYISGREAYFLAAASQRMLAASEADFKQSSIDLDDALAALEEDHRNNSAPNIDRARFDSERLAISLGRYYLARSQNPSLFMDEIVEEVYGFAHEAATILSDWLRNPESKKIRRVTAVNISVNLLQTRVIYEFRKASRLSELHSCPVSIDLMLTSIDTIKRFTNYSNNNRDAINATRLIRAYCLIAEMLIADRAANLSQLFSRFSKLISEMDALVVTYYDSWRYNALNKFISERFPSLRKTIAT